jgi:general secretion pathway protein D
MFFHRSFILLLLVWVTASGQQPAETPPPATEPAAPAAVPTPPAAVPATPGGVPATPGVTAPGGVPTRPPATTGPPAIPTPGGGAPPTGGLPGVKLPPKLPTKALPNIAGPQPGIPLGENKILEDIIEPKLSGSALAGLYRRFTGRRVIVSAAASTAEFAFVQEATPQDPLTYAKAAELLKKAATIENFVFVPDGEDPNLDILTLASGGIRPTGRGVDVYNENDPLPDGDAVISYVMLLSYIKPAEAVNTFTQIIGQFGAYGSIAAVPNAAAVVITENTSLIRKLIDLKKEIDKPSSQVATRFIKVQFADVTEIAQTLTELLTAQASSQKTAGIQRADAPPAPVTPAAPGVNPAAGAHPGGASSSGEETPVQIIPEPRTNRIFAMGRPVDLLFVEGLIREFDVPTSDKTFLRRKLRFLTVSDFLPIASDALTRAFSGTGEGGGGGTRSGGAAAGSQSGTNRTQSGSRSSGSSGRSSRTSGTSSGLGGSSSGFGGSSSYGGGSSGFGGSGGSGGMAGGGSALSAPSVSSAPESVLVGRTLLVADNITNSIVAQGPPSGLEIIERLLDQIDVKPDQVMISTVIGLLTLNDDKNTGLKYLWGSTSDNFKGGAGDLPGSIAPFINPTAAAAAAASGAFPNFDPSILTSGGLRLYGKVGDMNIFLTALQSRTDFTVLSRPSIFTSNNQKGTISSGSRIAIPTGTNSYGTGGNVSTQIQYQDVVLKLEVIPLVNSNQEITMQIALLSDEQDGTQTIEGGAGNGGNLTVPKISTREILTTATVPDNDTIVLGGLITNRNNRTKSGIPILCDIPYLGRLFSSNVDSKDRQELMVFIQPSIVNNSRSLTAVQSDMDNRYKVSGDSHRFADGNGVLPGIDDIPRLSQPATTAPAATAPPPKATPVSSKSRPVTKSNMKPSIRPANRR